MHAFNVKTRSEGMLLIVDIMQLSTFADMIC